MFQIFAHSLKKKKNPRLWSNLINALSISKFKKSFSVCSNFKRLSTCMVKKSYIVKVRTYINFFFFLVSHLPLV